VIVMSDFASFIEKQMNSFFRDSHFYDFIHKEMAPLVHLKEKDSAWILEIDLPLVDKNNIEVKISEDHLIVKAKLTKSFCISRGDVLTEFDYFKKTITLPSGINAKEISAKFKDGILKVTMRKSGTGKKIPIE
jgi:HSP20 family protein